MTLEITKGSRVHHSVYGTGVALNFYEFYNYTMVDVEFNTGVTRVSLDNLTTEK